jgi:aspartyl-tRNA(Asn)/glutamyl-tRNA(Gln) amidotransferase subunit A
VFGYRVSDAVAAARVLMPAYLRDRPHPASLPTIGFIDDPILSVASAAVANTLRTAADKFKGSSFRVKQCSSAVPFADIFAWHKTVMDYELARVHLSREHNEEVSAGLREAIGRGRAIDDLVYMDACRSIDAAREGFLAATTDLDVLIFPAAPDVAPAGMKTGDPRFIAPFTALGGPIVSIPVGYGAGGLPLGLMLIGAPGMDATIAGIAIEVAKIIELPR